MCAINEFEDYSFNPKHAGTSLVFVLFLIDRFEIIITFGDLQRQLHFGTALIIRNGFRLRCRYLHCTSLIS